MTEPETGDPEAAISLGQAKLAEVVQTLERISVDLEAISTRVVLFTFAHVAVGLALAILPRSLESYPIDFSGSIVTTISLMIASRYAPIIIDLLLLSFVVITLIRYDRLAKMGSIFFTELSNEHSWLRSNNEHMMFAYRIALRRFSAASELPLTTRSNGIIFYLTINAAISAMVLGLHVLSNSLGILTPIS